MRLTDPLSKKIVLLTPIHIININSHLTETSFPQHVQINHEGSAPKINIPLGYKAMEDNNQQPRPGCVLPQIGYSNYSCDLFHHQLHETMITFLAAAKQRSATFDNN